MKKFVVPAVALGISLLTVAALYAFARNLATAKTFDLAVFKAATIVSCNPNLSDLALTLEETDIPPMPGAGNYSWKISTRSDSAQFYFNQGINMYYGFHNIEALASFQKAARFDSNNGMIYWAQALTMGPGINDIYYEENPLALAAAQKALAASSHPQEREWIAAIQGWFSPDSSKSRKILNEDFIEAMRSLYHKYPRSADAATLYAYAIMVQHAWNYWQSAGRPQPWTPAIRSALEKASQLSPNHPGANHLYIHIMEASNEPAKALASAHKLGKLTPGLSHMVHMPSHIYLRTGDYLRGSAINEEAVKRYKEYRKYFPMAAGNPFLYQLHNQHMQVNNSIMAGRYQYSRQSSLNMNNDLDTSWLSMPAPLGAVVQYIYMTPALVDVHFGKWDAVLQQLPPAADHVYARILYYFSTGMAYAARKDGVRAHEQLLQLQQLIPTESLKVRMGPFSSAQEGALVAEAMLQGAIAIAEKRRDAAIAFLQKAVSLEETMVYNEPRDWLLNPKQYLGAAYLLYKQWGSAAAAFRKDLVQNNNNVWSLYGLKQSLASQNKKEALAIEARYRRASKAMDVKLDKMFF